MADYERRLERLEQQTARQTGDYNLTRINIIDSDSRPSDRIEYSATHDVLVRGEDEPVPDLKKRAMDFWGLSGSRRLVYCHFVNSNGRGGPRFTDAEYEAIGAKTPR